mgnify:CR=1 FL=1
MKRTRVSLGERSYEILSGSGAVKSLPPVVSGISSSSPVVVITDRNVLKFSGRMLEGVFKKIRNPLEKIILTPGEKSKSLSVFGGVVREITARTRGHRPIIIAIGGGVVGDLAGFVAATYRRGVPLVQVPTTLLAQVDSSVGGKVGIDMPEAKNIVGAFYQPRAVLSDTGFLKTLPLREKRNGMAEIIKYAVIKSPELFRTLENNVSKVERMDPSAIDTIIAECIKIKARVVEKDENDSGDIRIILNFGHTLGHAVEAASGFSESYNHGESVALGMVMACRIAGDLGVVRDGHSRRIEELILSYGLPVTFSGVGPDKIMSALKYDKKFISGVNRFILPERIGKVKVYDDVKDEIVRRAVKNVYAPKPRSGGK